MTWAQGRTGSFEDKMLPHLNAAYILARWLTGNQQDAEDAVQDAYLRAFRFFGDFRGENARGWLLKIVRNTCYSRLHAKHPDLSATPFDEEVHSSEYVSSSPETIAIQSSDAQVVKKAIEELPLRYREVLILREIEDMPYAEMAKVINQPLGTVRSTLFRARQELKKQLVGRARKEQSLIAPEPKHC